MDLGLGWLLVIPPKNKNYKFVLLCKINLNTLIIKPQKQTTFGVNIHGLIKFISLTIFWVFIVNFFAADPIRGNLIDLV